MSVCVLNVLVQQIIKTRSTDKIARAIFNQGRNKGSGRPRLFTI